MTTLHDLGWGESFASQEHPALDAMETTTARVACQDREGFDVLVDGGELVRARLGGGLSYRAASREELPCVGDWVFMRPQKSGPATIVGVYDRKTRIARQAAGRSTDIQIIAANVDTIFVVTSMNEEFEPRRLERYLFAVRDAGAEPVIVLNKADLADDPDCFERAAADVAGGAAVVGVSALAGPVDALQAWLSPGHTVAFVGSSGVGKSTLINRLLGENLQKTSDIRQDDAAGRHTTTARQLLVMPDGRGVLIDTPGMREFQLWAGETTVDDVFDDVADLAARCRFRDCAHDAEPGCAVREAVESGELPAQRLASWRKLQRELDFQERKQDVAARREESRKLGKVYRRAQDDNPKS